ncbi:MAG: mandelate racemase [Bauldia sp.]|nr:mandelate racemase [Bauldia sp.]
MRIVDVREASVPLEANIQNSVVSFADHTVSLVAVVSDVIRDGRPVTGVAFDSIGRYAQSGLLRERFIPRLLAARPDDLLDAGGAGIDPDRAYRAMMKNEKPGGHGDRAHAVAAVELAIWDLNAKLAGVPAWKLIADRHRVAARARMPVYAAGGYYYPEDSLGRLRDEMKAYGDMGYTSFKMKIGGAPLAEDMKRIEAALTVVGDAAALAVDANGRFDTPTAIAYGKAMAGFGLRWYEEPGDPLDYALMADLAGVYERPLATGENLFSLRDVDNLIRHGGMRKGHDLFQMDPALGYGLSEFARMVAAMEKAGYARAQLFPHGGHMIALHIVVGLGLGGSEAYPGVFAPVGGYAPDCTLEDGGIAPGERPGFGLEAKPDLAQHVARLVA